MVVVVMVAEAEVAVVVVVPLLLLLVVLVEEMGVKVEEVVSPDLYCCRQNLPLPPASPRLSVSAVLPE